MATTPQTAGRAATHDRSPTSLGSIKNLLLVETMKGDAMKAALNLRKWICVQQLSRVGGSSVRDCVDKVIDH
ncbi:hypothetical protein QQF64_022190 [Cirrhinus molitorella]|uniref:Uncharacterized protein n=1 Tax=Cirrhinus molitorella TaxID=172907 RepID=A0ABR3L7Q9_9TELE